MFTNIFLSEAFSYLPFSITTLFRARNGLLYIRARNILDTQIGNITSKGAASI